MRQRTVSHWEFGSLFWVRSRQFLTSKIVSVQHQESPLLKWLEPYCNYKSHICRETYHLLRKEVRLNFHQLHPQKAAIQVTKKYGNFLCFSRCMEAPSQKLHVKFAAFCYRWPFGTSSRRGRRISGETLGEGCHDLKVERGNTGNPMWSRNPVMRWQAGGIFFFWSKKNGWFFAFNFGGWVFSGVMKKKTTKFFFWGGISKNRKCMVILRVPSS